MCDIVVHYPSKCGKGERGERHNDNENKRERKHWNTRPYNLPWQLSSIVQTTIICRLLCDKQSNNRAKPMLMLIHIKSKEHQMQHNFGGVVFSHVSSIYFFFLIPIYEILMGLVHTFFCHFNMFPLNFFFTAYADFISILNHELTSISKSNANVKKSVRENEIERGIWRGKWNTRQQRGNCSHVSSSSLNPLSQKVHITLKWLLIKRLVMKYFQLIFVSTSTFSSNTASYDFRQIGVNDAENF